MRVDVIIHHKLFKHIRVNGISCSEGLQTSNKIVLHIIIQSNDNNDKKKGLNTELAHCAWLGVTNAHSKALIRQNETVATGPRTQ